MVWIDPAGLSALGQQLAALREAMIPPFPGAAPGTDVFGDAGLAAAAQTYARAAADVQLDGAQEVDTLSTDAAWAAGAWQQLDDTNAGQLRATGWTPR